MPVFAQIADMEARFTAADLVQLTDTSDAGVIDGDRIAQALERADAMITGYVATRHADVAVLAGNTLLTEIACDLAFYDLWREERPDHVKDRRKDALASLKDIAAGRMVLDSGTEVQPPRPDAILTNGSDRVFTKDSMAGF